MEVRIRLDAPTAEAAAAAAIAAFAVIARLDGVLSDYRPDSDVRAVARAAPEPQVVAPELIDVLDRALAIARATDGAFDPTVAPLAALWRQARVSGQRPSAEALAGARALVGWRRIEIDHAASSVRLPVAGMALDLGGIAKGYILQAALRSLQAHGGRGLIEAGGDVVASKPRADSPAWVVQIGCTALANDHRFVQPGSRVRSPVALLDGEALATSGASAQFVVIDGVRYSHVVDPSTGLGLTDHHTVHVRAADGATADGWATALSVLPRDRALAMSLPGGVRFCYADR